jgi:threonine dehydrogenase-like Zn-dependent dehydrogenase
VREMVTTGPGRMSLRRDAEEPTAGPGEALVEPAVVGLCGSDIHLFLGDHPYSHFPLVQGHEFSARVRTLPQDYAGDLRPGDLVAVEPYLSCDDCFPCRRGRPNCCTRLATLGAQVDGALRETLAVDVRKLHAVPGLSDELAALVEPISIGAMAVSRTSVRAGDRVLVIGAGPIGQAILLAPAGSGVEVAVADRLGNRLELADDLGASTTVDTSHEDLGARVSAWTDGDGPAVVFEATGVPRLLRQAVDLVAPSGDIVVVGLSTDEVAIPVVEFTRKELNVLGSRAGDFTRAVEIVTELPHQAERLITHRLPWQEAQEALRLAIEHPADVEKVLVRVR